MKNINDFVDPLFSSDSFKKCFKQYHRYIEQIVKLKQKKGEFDTSLHSLSTEPERTSSWDLTFKEKYVIYTILREAMLEQKESYYGVDLYFLKAKFEYLYDDLHEYLQIAKQIGVLEKHCQELLMETITFQHFGNNPSCHHCFILEDGALQCIYCGATTKEYALRNDEFQFLVLSAKKKGILLEHYKKEDWPFLEMMTRREYEHQKEASKYVSEQQKQAVLERKFENK